MIRIVLCDDQDIVTEGMQVILSTVRGFEVIGVAHDGAEAVDLVAELNPDRCADGPAHAHHERHPGHPRNPPDLPGGQSAGPDHL